MSDAVSTSGIEPMPPASVDRPAEPLPPASVDRPVPVERSWDIGIVSRLWVRLGAAELLLLAPGPLIVLARLGIQPRIDAVAAAALSMALPLVLGMTAMAVPARILRGRRHRWTLIDIGTAMALGLVLLSLGLAVMLHALGRFDTRTAGLLIALALGLVGWLILRVLDIADAPRADSSARAVHWTISLAGSSWPASVWRSRPVLYRFNSPVPYPPNGTRSPISGSIDSMLSGVWSPWTTDYSETFRVNAYFPVQQLLTAVASRLTKVDPLDIYWGGPFVMMPDLWPILAYAIARALKVRQVTAILVAGGSRGRHDLPGDGIPRPAAARARIPLLQPGPAGGHEPGTVAHDRRDGGRVGGGRADKSLVDRVGGPRLRSDAARPALPRRPDRGALDLSPSSLSASSPSSCSWAIRASGCSPRRLSASPPAMTASSATDVSLASRQLDFQARLSAVLAFGSAAGALILAWRGRPGSRRTMLALVWAGSLTALALPVAGADRGFAVLPILAPTLAAAIDRVFDLALRPGRGLGERGLAAGIAMTAVVAIAIQPVFWVSGYQHARASSSPFFQLLRPDRAQGR